jgi:hypothetical protein
MEEFMRSLYHALAVGSILGALCTGACSEAETAPGTPDVLPATADSLSGPDDALGEADTADAASDVAADVTVGSDADTEEDAAPDSGPGTRYICFPGVPTCIDLYTPGQCNAEGTAWEPLNKCLPGQTCHADTDACGPKACEPGTTSCVDEDTKVRCLPDGSGLEPEQDCPDGSVCNAGLCISPSCFPKVMFLVDRSTSMSPHWESVQKSITAVIEANPEVQFGLTVFPSAGGFFAGCETGTNSPHVPLQDGAAIAIDQWFDQNEPAGATPLKSAVEWTADNVAAVWGDDTTNAFLVVLSDGEDKCTCSQHENDPQERAECVAEKLVVSTQKLLQQGVRTFVIGYAYSGPDDELNAIAENGGTDEKTWIYAGSESTLTNAFGKVIDDVKLCF